MSTTLSPSRSTALPRRSRLGVLQGPVLLASDGRGPTDATARVARRAAERLRAPLVVVAALPVPSVYPLPFEMPMLPVDVDATCRRGLADAVVRRLTPVLGPTDGWTMEIAEGTPAWAVTDVARERGAALLVVGAGGRGVIDRLLGGGAALGIVRHAATPVLAVVAGRERHLRRAVVGVDFGAASVRAARAALALLDRDGETPPRLLLVHVVDGSPDEPPRPGMPVPDRDTRLATMFARLRELLLPYAPDGTTIETRVRTGPVAVALRAAADALNADLIAVGTHGPGWVERLFVGSVADDVLRHADVDVLVCPTPDVAERLRVQLYVGGHDALDRPTDWTRALDLFSERNAGRTARLEVGDPELRGPAVEASRFRFLGATYDPHDRRVSLMLSDPADYTRHLTHSASHVHALEILAGDDGGDRALLVEDARGHTLLSFRA